GVFRRWQETRHARSSLDPFDPLVEIVPILVVALREAGSHDPARVLVLVDPDCCSPLVYLDLMEPRAGCGVNRAYSGILRRVLTEAFRGLPQHWMVQRGQRQGLICFATFEGALRVRVSPAVLEVLAEGAERWSSSASHHASTIPWLPPAGSVLEDLGEFARGGVLDLLAGSETLGEFAALGIALRDERDEIAKLDSTVASDAVRGDGSVVEKLVQVRAAHP